MIIYYIHIWLVVDLPLWKIWDPNLVGGIPTPLKNMTSSVGMMKFPTEWTNKKCSKPPTSYKWIRNRATHIFRKPPFNRGCTRVFRRFTNNFVESLREIMGEKSNGSCPPSDVCWFIPPHQLYRDIYHKPPILVTNFANFCWPRSIPDPWFCWPHPDVWCLPKPAPLV